MQANETESVPLYGKRQLLVLYGRNEYSISPCVNSTVKYIFPVDVRTMVSDLKENIMCNRLCPPVENGSNKRLHKYIVHS